MMESGRLLVYCPVSHFQGELDVLRLGVAWCCEGFVGSSVGVLCRVTQRAWGGAPCRASSGRASGGVASGTKGRGVVDALRAGVGCHGHRGRADEACQNVSPV